MRNLRIASAFLDPLVLRDAALRAAPQHEGY
jgi:hypothetical protein